MVARLPLEEKIGVRIPVRQQFKNTASGILKCRKKTNCLAFARDSKGFSVRAKRGGKAPADVIGEKCIHGPCSATRV